MVSLSFRSNDRAFGTDLANALNKQQPGSALGFTLQTANISKKQTKSKQTENISKNIFVEVADFDSMLHKNELYSIYINETMSYFFQNEKSMRDYIKNPKSTITKEIRVIIFNWIITVHEKFQLDDNTLYLTINIMDRYFGSTNGMVQTDQLKKIACASLWIASKYHEIYVPEIDDFNVISGGSVKREELKQMEIIILNAIDFDLTVETQFSFIQRFYQIGEYYIGKAGNNVEIALRKKKILKSLMMLCTEICINDYKLSLQPPSKLACSILYYCCVGTGIFSFKEFKSDNLLKYVNNYSMHDVRHIMERMHKKAIESGADKSGRLYKKYSTADQHHVIQIPSKMYSNR